MAKEKTKRNEKMRKLREKGLSYAQIGRIFGIHKTAVWRIINKKR